MIGRRLAVGTTTSYGRVYAAMVAALDALLAEIDDWTVIAAYSDWTVHDLVAHLAATDSLLADQLAVPTRPWPGDDIDSRTDSAVSQKGPFAETWDQWRDQAAAICGALADIPADQVLTVPPISMPAKDIMAFRAFETWVHATDIATAVGCTLPTPPAEHLHRIADLGARSLPAAVATKRIRLDDRSVRVVLTGEGGGDWLVPRPSNPTAVELEMDTVAFCLLLADRLTATEAGAIVRGDHTLGHEILDAAASLAGR